VVKLLHNDQKNDRLPLATFVKTSLETKIKSRYNDYWNR